MINIILVKSDTFSECVDNSLCNNNCQGDNICLKITGVICGPGRCSESFQYKCEKINGYYCCNDSNCPNNEKCEGGICRVPYTDSSTICYGDTDCKGKCSRKGSCFCINGECHN